jgi:hypothetical protein
LVPHSHDDLGWIKTFDEYYDDEVRHIYTSVMKSLIANSDRKFTIVEIGFFSKWYHE